MNRRTTISTSLKKESVRLGPGGEIRTPREKTKEEKIKELEEQLKKLKQ